MARPLAGRVARLERARSPACPACGGGPGPVTYRVVVPEATARVPAAHAHRKPELCGACGRARRFWITMVPARAGEA